MTTCGANPIRVCTSNWACCRLINAQRLAPLEEVLAELRGELRVHLRDKAPAA